MSDRMINSLKTLMRIEDLNIKSYGAALKELKDKISDIEDEMILIEKNIQDQKDFLKNNHISDLPPLAYFNRMNDDIKKLAHQKTDLQSQLDALFEELFAHVANEKAYSKIYEKLKIEKKNEEEKKEADALEDLFSILSGHKEI
ncbi:MAG: hypothetical protein CNLJKLNK_00681 [Holosporales bacterium]